MKKYSTVSAEERKVREAQVVSLSKQGYTPSEIANRLNIKSGRVYYILADYKLKNPQERAHITMRINKMNMDNVSRDGEKITKNVTTQKVLTYGEHIIVLDDRFPRKIYLKANGDVHIE
jgi:transposase